MPKRPPRLPFFRRWLGHARAPLVFLHARRRGPLADPDGGAAERASRAVASDVPTGSPDDETAQRAELFARLLTHDPATRIVRHLLVVHDAWRRSGWTAAASLPASTVGRALFEAEVLAAEDPSPLFSAVVARLGQAHAAANAREASRHDSDWAAPPVAEVADSDFVEFELMERSWAGTVPAGL
jgi:hypothetical protein